MSDQGTKDRSDSRVGAVAVCAVVGGFHLFATNLLIILPGVGLLAAAFGLYHRRPWAVTLSTAAAAVLLLYHFVSLVIFSGAAAASASTVAVLAGALRPIVWLIGAVAILVLVHWNRPYRRNDW